MESTKLNENLDILSELEAEDKENQVSETFVQNLSEDEQNESSEVFDSFEKEEEYFSEDKISDDLEVFEEVVIEEDVTMFSKIRDFILFSLKYIVTCTLVFVVLILAANFQAYYQFAEAYLYPDVVKQREVNLKASINDASGSEQIAIKESEKVDILGLTESELKELKTKIAKTDAAAENKVFHSMTKLVNAADEEEITFDIDIIPYENRIVIPKIAKNVPLLDVKKRTAKNVKELEDIFMKELEDGVVRYPGSSMPWEDGNTFIFGHSSNFAWAKGDYNDVFAKLDDVRYNDEVYVYYNQKKYTYKIKHKKVVRPGDVRILTRNKRKSEITLMTCFPVGTTLNRLVVIGELISVE